MNLIDEINKSIERAKLIHGDKFTYEPIAGVQPDLRKLLPNQRVCAGGKTFHLLMTKEA